MATQKLYLYETTSGIQKLGSSLSTSYEFDGKELAIFWKGREKRVKATFGDAFCIGCNGGFPDVSRLKLPRNNYKLILWLCGFYAYNGSTNREEFQELLEKRRNELDWWAYEEYGTKTEEYSFILCTRSDCGGEHHVAGFIDRNLPLTRERIIEILNSYYQIRESYIPVQFVKEVLKKRFKMNDLDLEKIHFRVI